MLNFTWPLVAALIAGLAFVIAVMLYCNKEFKFPVWKVILLALYSMITGYISVKLMFFIENGKWGGTSFFGGVLFMPAFLLVFALALKLKYLQVLDLCSPGICIVSAVMKIRCIIDGCCKGIILYTDSAGQDVRFPSQIVELVFALLLMVCMIYWIKTKKYPNKLYPLFMIIYGEGRFGLNFLRETNPFISFIPAGHFWAVISVIVGVIFCWCISKYEKGQNQVKK